MHKHCCNCQPKSDCPEEGRKEGRLYTFAARRSCSPSKLKFFENSLTYWIMFNLKTRRLLTGLTGTFIPLVGSSRQLAGYALWNFFVNSDLSGHEESLLLLSPAGNGCPLLRPQHRNWLHIQPARCRTGDHSCKPVFLCNCSVTGSRHMGSCRISAEGCQLFTLLQQKQDHL